MPDARTGRVRVAVLISGAGSNMAALIDAAGADDCPFEIVLVLSNRPEAGDQDGDANAAGTRVRHQRAGGAGSPTETNDPDGPGKTTGLS